MAEPTCTVAGCERRSRNAKSDALCPMHYHRQYRHGSVARGPETSPSTATPRLYRSIMAPTHPLAPPSGRVYVHRIVLFDSIGPGPHACRWCGVEVDWKPRGEDGALVADHLNGVKDDNRPENLVPSCVSCNNTRAMQQRGDAMRAAGWWSEHDTVARLSVRGRRERIDAA